MIQNDAKIIKTYIESIRLIERKKDVKIVNIEINLRTHFDDDIKAAEKLCEILCKIDIIEVNNIIPFTVEKKIKRGTVLNYKSFNGLILSPLQSISIVVCPEMNIRFEVKYKDDITLNDYIYNIFVPGNLRGVRYHRSPFLPLRSAVTFISPDTTPVQCYEPVFGETELIPDT